MKIKRMTKKQIESALEKARKECPGSQYEKHLKAALKIKGN